jgi:hypothetical protein
LKDWANSAENYLIQQSCIKFNETTVKDNSIGDMTVNLHLNKEEFEKEWKESTKLINDMNRHISASGRWCSTPNQTLKSLVGKWVIRIKPVTTEYGEDDSYIKAPLFIINATDNHVDWYTSQYGFCNKKEITEPLRKVISSLSTFDRNEKTEIPFLDDNWKEYKQ